jgi:hypothetical protein
MTHLTARKRPDVKVSVSYSIAAILLAWALQLVAALYVVILASPARPLSHRRTVILARLVQPSKALVPILVNEGLLGCHAAVVLRLALPHVPHHKKSGKANNGY